VTWLAHLLLFLGTLPRLTDMGVVRNISSWLCLAPPLATPFLLAAAALHGPRPLADGRHQAQAALGLGLLLAGAVVLSALHAAATAS
jgi:hypothetical protein